MRVVRYDELTPTKAQRESFTSGEPSLDRWLAMQARQSMASRDAITYVLVDDATEPATIAGYYCLSTGSVSKADLPDRLAKHSPRPVPIVRLGRFAIDQRYQGAGWGADLLREALLSAVNGAQLVGGRALLVDAISDRAASFYRRFGFVDSPIHPLQLFKDLRVIRTSAGLDDS